MPVNASGSMVMLQSASGTNTIPVYIDSPIPVSVAVDIETDSIKIHSASGTTPIPVYIEGGVTASIPDIVEVKVKQEDDSIRVYSASGTSPIPVYLESDLDFNNDSVTIESDFINSSGFPHPHQKKLAVMGSKAYTTLPTPVDDGDAMYFWMDEYGRQVPYGANLSQGSIDVSEVAPAEQQVTAVTFTQLTGPSATAATNVIDHSMHTYAYTIASIDTSVEVAVSGSLDSTNWYNVNPSGAVMMKITENGTYVTTYDHKTTYLLFAFMQETGGTAATIDVKLLSGR